VPAATLIDHRVLPRVECRWCASNLRADSLSLSAFFHRMLVHRRVLTSWLRPFYPSEGRGGQDVKLDTTMPSESVTHKIEGAVPRISTIVHLEVTGHGLLASRHPIYRRWCFRHFGVTGIMTLPFRWQTASGCILVVMIMPSRSSIGALKVHLWWFIPSPPQKVKFAHLSLCRKEANTMAHRLLLLMKYEHSFINILGR
jgi:hypothetical protein